MTEDENLRSLERAARAPDADHAAGFRYAQALARAGRRRDHFLELARLARGSMPEAQRELDRWNPRGGAEGRASPRSVLRAAARVRAKEIEAVEVRTSKSRLIGASDRVVLIAAESTKRERVTLAIDLEELTLRWSAGLIIEAMQGDDAIEQTGRALVVRSTIDGSELARAEVQLNEDRRFIRLEPGLALHGDRAIAIARFDRRSDDAPGTPRRTVAFDVGAELARPIWVMNDVSPSQFLDASRFFCTEDAGRLTMRSTADARILWRKPDEPPRPFSGDIGVVPPLADPGDPSRGDARAIAALRSGASAELWDAQAGELRWMSTPITWPRAGLTIGDGVIIVRGFASSAGALGVIAIDRETGKTRWQDSLPAHSLALCDDALYAVSGANGRVELSVVDLDTGARVIARDLGLGFKANLNGIHLIPLERALAMIIALPRRLIVARVDE